MEQKFRLLRMTEELKAEYAAHQLQGSAGIWWSHHRTTYLEGTPITWNRFTTAFRGNYIPPGGRNEGWRIHEAVSRDQIYEGVSACFQQSCSLRSQIREYREQEDC